MEKALDVSYDMHVYAMRFSRPGIFEQEIAGAIEGIALAAGGYVAYPVIFSVDGQTLHNHYHGNVMQAGDIIVNDSGASVASHYASDITRTIPVSGKFTPEQKDMYNIVLEALNSANAKVAPGVRFKEVHLHACKILAAGLKDKGLMKGDIEEAVQAGAHALFFQCGVGHMLGLDVHDMEDLGEEFVGYDEETRRSPQFGLSYLRLGKKLQPGFVVTVEPGLYFIPELIDIWQAENKFSQFINYDVVERYRDFGGIRIEDNLVVTQTGQRFLGKPIPKTAAEVEAVCGSK
jgi:Xaa-Pro aminopeptidase